MRRSPLRDNLAFPPIKNSITNLAKYSRVKLDSVLTKKLTKLNIFRAGEIDQGGEDLSTNKVFIHFFFFDKNLVIQM